VSGGWEGSDRKSRLPSNWATIRRKVLDRDPICKLCGVRPSTLGAQIQRVDEEQDTDQPEPAPPKE